MSELIVRTVLGDVAPASLGRTDYHEHLFHSSPLLPGDDLDDPSLSDLEAVALKAGGIDAVADLTPIGLGRNLPAVVEISKGADIHVIAATGVHQEAHYDQDHWVRDLNMEALVSRFTSEVVEALDTSAGGEPHPIEARAGVIKVGVGYWSISDFERRVLEAAAEAHCRTGVPIVCHLELGTAAWEVAAILESAGVARDKIALAHIDRNPDEGLHYELAASGLYLGYDGFARAKHWPDSTLLDCLVKVATMGGAERLLLGGDVARRSSFVSYGGLPGMDYLPTRFIPRLRAATSDEFVHKVLVRNPAAFFAFVPADARPGRDPRR